MKKLVAFLCAVVMLLLFAACAAGEGGKEIPGALPEILDRLYDTAEVDDARFSENRSRHDGYAA